MAIVVDENGIEIDDSTVPQEYFGLRLTSYQKEYFREVIRPILDQRHPRTEDDSDVCGTSSHEYVVITSGIAD